MALASDNTQSKSSQTFEKDPYCALIGSHVRVIKRHQFKDYIGIIKSTQGGFVLVELQVMPPRMARISLWNLALECVPLSINRILADEITDAIRNSRHSAPKR